MKWLATWTLKYAFTNSTVIWGCFPSVNVVLAVYDVSWVLSLSLSLSVLVSIYPSGNVPEKLILLNICCSYGLLNIDLTELWFLMSVFILPQERKHTCFLYPKIINEETRPEKWGWGNNFFVGHVKYIHVIEE